jgi:hypothetical protein
MGRDRSVTARLVLAAIYGAAQRHANWHDLDDTGTAAAVDELREIVVGRDDGPELLAEAAGLLLGAHEGELDEARAMGAAQLCIAGGADKTLIPRWIEEGRRRRANARKRPYTGCG